MKVVFILALLVAAASARNLMKRTARQRTASVPFVVGGQPAAKGTWPWQLSLQVRDYDEDWAPFYRHTCGAVLLNENWVLCAAHCVMLADDEEDYELLAGASNSGVGSRNPEQVLKVAQSWMHPEFSVLEPGLPHDIALFKLATPADLNNQFISGIDLASGNNDFAGASDCWITGWGRLGWDHSGSSPILQELEIPVFTNEECDRRWYDAPLIGGVHPILAVHICVGDDAGTQSACQGDSGGPLSCKEDGEWVVAGITSRGWPDCEIYPSVYTRVSSYKQWIEDTIRNN